jgi:hypothetical protein
LLLWRDGREQLERADKNILAQRLIARIAERMRAVRAGAARA